ncbi:hypothetical protein RIF29_03593 [Crotalaria pallida]|uniref:Uncharacterized protein n=1 Tax=Crotalaria pallida TaxID=3830 RepID=A0AAN9J102_CROPI
MNLVQRKSDELALASGEHGESVNNVGSKVVLGSKGSSSLTHQFSGANNTASMFTDEFYSSVAILNIALLKICIDDLRLLAWIFTLNSNEDKSNACTMDNLHHLSQLVEEKDGGLPWIQMMGRSTPTMSYQARRREPKEKQVIEFKVEELPDVHD